MLCQGSHHDSPTIAASVSSARSTAFSSASGLLTTTSESRTHTHRGSPEPLDARNDIAWVSAGPCMVLPVFAMSRHPPAASIFVSSSADPSVEPLSTMTISSDSHSRIRRSDHSKSAVSSRVLYETVTTATRPGVTGQSGQ